LTTENWVKKQKNSHILRGFYAKLPEFSGFKNGKQKSSEYRKTFRVYLAPENATGRFGNQAGTTSTGIFDPNKIHSLM
jgi:hypothetical protein